MKKIILIISLATTCLLNQAQVVSIFAGSGSPGSINATGIAASFNSPSGVCTDAVGNIYVADPQNQKIRKITPAGVVSTFAGSGATGSANGTGIAASFSFPQGVCIDAAGNIYVADYNNHKIRKITPASVVSTFAGSGTSGSTDGTGIAASFNYPNGVCTDATGNVYVADANNHKIRKITPGGVVTTFAGSGTPGSTDGTGIAASFYYPYGVCTDASGNVYVAGNNKIRKITSVGVVTTFAGSGAAGSNDATGIAASFNGPIGICTDAAGNVYVADTDNHKIRKITPSGAVTTLAGSGISGSNDGIGVSASFNFPRGVCTNSAGNVYVADDVNNKIRKIDTLSINTNIPDIGVSNSIIQVYPNPTSSVLTIRINETLQSLKIYDLLGSLIQTENKTTFSVEQLPAGIYSIQIKTVKGLAIARFIKE